MWNSSSGSSEHCGVLCSGSGRPAPPSGYVLPAPAWLVPASCRPPFLGWVETPYWQPEQEALGSLQHLQLSLYKAVQYASETHTIPQLHENTPNYSPGMFMCMHSAPLFVKYRTKNLTRLWLRLLVSHVHDGAAIAALGGDGHHTLSLTRQSEGCQGPSHHSSCSRRRLL